MTALPDVRPAAAGLEACVYVVGFKNNLIKVGYSANIAKRLQQHHDNGNTHGNPVVAYWASLPHLRASENEQALIAYCSRNGKGAQGREWFTGIPFAHVRTFAKALPIERATDEQIKQHKQDSQARTKTLIQALGLPLKPRLLSLPEQISIRQIPPAGDDENDFDQLCEALALLLKIPASEAAILPEEIWIRVMHHAVKSINLGRDIDFFEKCLAEARARLVAHATGPTDELRQEVREAAKNIAQGTP